MGIVGQPHFEELKFEDEQPITIKPPSRFTRNSS